MTTQVNIFTRIFIFASSSHSPKPNQHHLKSSPIRAFFWVKSANCWASQLLPGPRSQQSPAPLGGCGQVPEGRRSFARGQDSGLRGGCCWVRRVSQQARVEGLSEGTRCSSACATCDGASPGRPGGQCSGIGIYGSAGVGS